MVPVLVSYKTIRHKSKRRKNFHAEAGAGVLIRIYGSAEPVPKEIFNAPQRCLLAANFSVEDPKQYCADQEEPFKSFRTLKLRKTSFNWS